ncbi:MAG TPA: IS701 family transposase [Chloroflexota bacterium]|nr:IS701 family transposase [Chloroflexota bacterium]
MGLKTSAGGSESRFATYVEAITSALGHADRAAPFRSYCAGLLLPGERKSVEPMAARIHPARVQAAHQSLHHFVAKADWSDEAVLTAVRTQVLPVIERRGRIRALILDDTGFPKKGKHSVGVARQYCGQLGKQDNCQVAVSLSVANEHASLPIAWRLYLPREWADDPARRAAAGVPDEIVFQTKTQIALAQLRAARAAGIKAEVALLDAGYGTDTDLRDGITEIGLPYVVGIQSTTSLWPPGVQPLPPKPWSGRGRPTRAIRRSTEHQPVSAKQLALSLPNKAWRRVTWREGTNTKLASRFAAVRVRPAHRDYQRSAPRPEEWCLIEWPADQAEPTKYWLSTLPATISRRALVNTAKLRWRIERDYQELKQELGLGHYEGRGWRGFHHHATLCIAAYGFLVCEREAIPPSGQRRAIFREEPAVPDGYRPRGSPDPA